MADYDLDYELAIFMMIEERKDFDHGLRRFGFDYSLCDSDIGATAKHL